MLLLLLARLVKRLGLTRQQALHFAVAMEEIGRLDRATLQHNGALARTAACPSLLVAASSAAAATLAGAAAADGGVGDAAEQQQQDAAGGSRSGRARAPPAAARSHRTIASPQPSSAGSSGSAPAAAAAAASYDDGSGDGSDGSDGDGSSSAPVRAEILLQRKVQRIPLQGVLLLSFNVNTLSRLQVAKVIVSGTRPWAVGPAAACVAAFARCHAMLLHAAVQATNTAARRCWYAGGQLSIPANDDGDWRGGGETV